MGSSLFSSIGADNFAQAANQAPPATGVMSTPAPTGASYGKGGAAANNQPLTPGAGGAGLGDFFNSINGQSPNGIDALNGLVSNAGSLVNDAVNATVGNPSADTGGFNYPTLPGYTPGGPSTQNPLIQKGVMPQNPSTYNKYAGQIFGQPAAQQTVSVGGPLGIQVPGAAMGFRAPQPRPTARPAIRQGRAPRPGSGRITY